ncbi:MAG: fibronectin type III domain-containing protein [Chloroflexi bacterium]|nr:fibronectin type III domain-containing protein [Chloroflexota bacterium]
MVVRMMGGELVGAVRLGLLALVSVGLLAGYVGSGTYAAFVAQTTNPHNVFQAGTLRLTNSRSGEALFAVEAIGPTSRNVATGGAVVQTGPTTGGLAPGSTLANSLTLTNSGTLPAGELRLRIPDGGITNTNDVAAHCHPSNSGNAATPDCGRQRLSDVLELLVYYPVDGTGTHHVCVYGSNAANLGRVAAATAAGMETACGFGPLTTALPLAATTTVDVATGTAAPALLAGVRVPHAVASDTVQAQWPAGQSRTVQLVVRLPEGATNAVQGAKATVDLLWKSVAQAATTGTAGTLGVGGSAAAYFPPGPPQNVSADAGDGEVTVTWQPPADDGGGAVTAYTVTAVEDSTKTATLGGAARSVRFTGLTNGASYTFAVRASNAFGTGAAAMSPAVAGLTTVSFSAAGFNVSEGAGQAAVTVTLGAPSAATVSVGYATSDGTASVARGDYTATSGSLTFAPGETSKSIAVAVTNDTLLETSEAFTVTLSSPVNATTGTLSSATVTIADNDPGPSLVAAIDHETYRYTDDGVYAYSAAVNPTTNRIYVARGKLRHVTVVDGATNTVITSIEVPESGTNIRDVAVNPTTNRIYATDGNGTRLLVIDGATNSVIDSVSLGSYGAFPIGVAVDPSTNRIYVANYGSGEVKIVDGASHTVTSRWIGGSPAWIAVNPDTHRVFVKRDNQLVVFDDVPGSGNAIVSVGGARRVAVNPTTNRVYVTSIWGMSYGTYVIDGATLGVVALIDGIGSEGIGVNAVTNRVFAWGGAAGAKLSVIDGDSHALLATLSVANAEYGGIGVNPNTNRVYVAKSGYRGGVYVIQN